MEEKKLCFKEPRKCEERECLNHWIGSIQTWHSSPDNRVRMDQRNVFKIEMFCVPEGGGEQISGLMCIWIGISSSFPGGTSRVISLKIACSRSDCA